MPEEHYTNAMRDPRLSKLYSVRFAAHEKERKDRVRRVLCRHFLQRYIEPECTVLDIGAGYCELINHIVCLRSGLRSIRVFTCSGPEVGAALPRSSRSEGPSLQVPPASGIVLAHVVLEPSAGYPRRFRKNRVSISMRFCFGAEAP